MSDDHRQPGGQQPGGQQTGGQRNGAPQSSGTKVNLNEAAKRAVAPAPLRKRFYKAVGVEKDAAGWQVLLDGRGLKTPGKKVLELPAQVLADAIAAEWQAQTNEIDPITMPLTRLANSAIDGVAGREAEVRADIVKYAGSDALCYRAERPQALVAKQAESWDPVLDWVGEALGARFVLASGIMPVEQPDEALAAVDLALAEFEALPLAALHVMTTLTGSALLMLAHARGFLSVEDAWAAAHVDEDFQIENWGEDEEAKARRLGRQKEMLAASRFLDLLA